MYSPLATAWERDRVAPDEWVAAVYESHTADHEYVATFGEHVADFRRVTEYDVTRAASYAHAAERVAEEIEASW